MQRFSDFGYSKRQLLRLNRCRLFLQVITLAEISDGSGDKICNMAYNGHRNFTRKSPFLWTVQPRPDANHWKLWRQALRKCFSSHGRLLRVPLGGWIDRDETHWKWFLEVNSKYLFHKQAENGRWKLFKREGGRGSMKKGNIFRFISTCLQKPPSAVRATVTRNANNNRVTLSR